AAIAFGTGEQGRPDCLVDDALETDRRVVAEEPDLPERRDALVRLEAHHEPLVSVATELLAQRLEVARPNAFVGVDVKDPFAAAEVERAIARCREVVLPGQGIDEGARGARDRRAAVA